MNIFHLYYNYFVLFVFLQIVNLGELVFDKKKIDLLCHVFNLFICSSSCSEASTFCINVSETEEFVYEPLKKFI